MIKFWRIHQSKQLIKASIQSEITKATDQFNKLNNKHQLAADISLILRRFTKFVLKDSIASSYTGEQWLSFLNKLTPSQDFQNYKFELLEAQFIPNAEYDAPEYIAMVRNFIIQAIDNNKQIIIERLKKNKNKTAKGVKNA